MQERPLGSRYILTELLGRGAMGQVYRARSRDGGEVAVKLLQDHLTSDSRLVSRFLQEGRLLRSIDHPNVVRIRDLVAEGDDLAIVMDLVPLGDLRRAMAVPCPPETAIRIGRELAEGLAAVHAAGITHRDLKFENVLMSQDADGLLHPRITDFGISRFVDASISRGTGLLGTPGYMAPEVLHGAPVGPASDVYALGVILYELCSGRAPFIADNPMALIRAHAADDVPPLTGLPAPLGELLLVMLDKQPTARPTAPQIAQALGADVSDSINGVTVRVTRPEPEAPGTVMAWPQPSAPGTVMPQPSAPETVTAWPSAPETVTARPPVPGTVTARAESQPLTMVRRRSAGMVPPVAAGTPSTGRRWALWGGLAAVVVLLLVGATGIVAMGRENSGSHEATLAPSPTSAADASAADGVAPDGVAADGVAPDGVAADGAASDGVAADGAVPATTHVRPSVTRATPRAGSAAAAATSPSSHPAARSTSGARDPVAPAADDLVSVGLSGGARLYFGSLSSIFSGVKGVNFSDRTAYAQAHSQMCGSTVVVRGLSGKEGAVYSTADGWSAAEVVPSQDVAGGGTLHQQVVIAPPSAAPGQSWTFQSSVTLDGVNTGLGSTRLTVTSQDGPTLVWSVAGTTARCSAS